MTSLFIVSQRICTTKSYLVIIMVELVFGRDHNIFIELVRTKLKKMQVCQIRVSASHLKCEILSKHLIMLPIFLFWHQMFYFDQIKFLTFWGHDPKTSTTNVISNSLEEYIYAVFQISTSVWWEILFYIIKWYNLDFLLILIYIKIFIFFNHFCHGKCLNTFRNLKKVRFYTQVHF